MRKGDEKGGRACDVEDEVASLSSMIALSFIFLRGDAKAGKHMYVHRGDPKAGRHMYAHRVDPKAGRHMYAHRGDSKAGRHMYGHRTGANNRAQRKKSGSGAGAGSTKPATKPAHASSAAAASSGAVSKKQLPASSGRKPPSTITATVDHHLAAELRRRANERAGRASNDGIAAPYNSATILRLEQNHGRVPKLASVLPPTRSRIRNIAVHMYGAKPVVSTMKLHQRLAALAKTRQKDYTRVTRLISKLNRCADKENDAARDECMKKMQNGLKEWKIEQVSARMRSTARTR
jgi:hypothetical protein